MLTTKWRILQPLPSVTRFISETKYKLWEHRFKAVGIITTITIHNFHKRSKMHPANWTETNPKKSQFEQPMCFVAKMACRYKLAALHKLLCRDLKFINPLSFAVFKSTHTEKWPVSEKPCILQFSFETWQGLIHSGIYFTLHLGQAWDLKAMLFPLKHSLQKIYHTFLGYLKLSKGNINRFFSKCALWSTGGIKPFLWKAWNRNSSGAWKPRAFCPTKLESLAPSNIRIVFLQVYVNVSFFVLVTVCMCALLQWLWEYLLRSKMLLVTLFFFNLKQLYIH